MEEYRLIITTENTVKISDKEDRLLFRESFPNRDNVVKVISNALCNIMENPSQKFLPGYPW